MGAPKFKVGDRVKFTTNYNEISAGETGVVTEAGHICTRVEMDRPIDYEPWPYNYRLELVEPAYQPSKGDKVRVTYEGVVDYIGRNGGVDVRLPDGRVFAHQASDVELVEKAKAEVFQPGDYVRYKTLPEYTFLILDNGYVDLNNRLAERATAPFTSEHYEKFEMAEVPL